MNNLVNELKAVCLEVEQRGIRQEVLRIKLKEKLQLYVLDFIYNNPTYNHLIMYGGTSLRICYDLGRMSEDIDFETAKPFDKKQFASDIKNYFIKKIRYPDITTHVPGQNIGRVELRFPVLFELGQSRHEDEKLILKVEVNQIKESFQTSFMPVTEGQFSFVIRHYILQVLMAGKISACLTRTWEKRGVKIKGRDFFDLLWYMQKRVIPESGYLAFKGYTISQAFKELDEKMNLINQKDVLADLGLLFENRNFPEEWTKKMKEMYQMMREKYQTGLVKNSELNTQGPVHKNFDRGTFSIPVSCKNESGREISWAFLFSKEWMDDEGRKLSENQLKKLCEEKARKYLENKSEGQNIIPANYETKLVVTSAGKSDKTSLVQLDINGFKEISLEDLVQKDKMYARF